MQYTTLIFQKKFSYTLKLERIKLWQKELLKEMVLEKGQEQIEVEVVVLPPDLVEKEKNNNMTIKYLIMHHSAVSYSRNFDQWVANNNYHRKKWNFKSSLGYYLGYNYEISKYGKVRQARRDGEITAACYQQGMNSGKAIHIELDGNFDIELPTQRQTEALTKLLLSLKKKYPDAIIKYHRDFAFYKSCPGKLIHDNWAKNLITNNMIYVIDKKKNQYLRDEVLKIAISISDEKELKLLVNRGLSGSPKKVNDMSKYLIYRGMFEKSWKNILNL